MNCNTKKVIIDTTFVKTSVNSLKVTDNVIFIGTGNFVMVYDRNLERIVGKTYIFDQTITGLELKNQKLLIYGENVLGLFEIHENNEIIALKNFEFNDWISSAKFLNSDRIAFVSMHSEAVLLTSETLELLDSSKSTEICTCYSAHTINEEWEDLYILSGTAFSSIFIWKPCIKTDGKSPVLYRLEGHKGVIFSIDYSESLKLICSTSDDGKAIVWLVKNGFAIDNKIEHKETLNDHQIISPIKELQHRQRVFRCKFFKNFLVTALEDSTVKIWDCLSDFKVKNGVHQLGPVWSLDFCERDDVLFTGGADGGIISMPMKELTFREVTADLKPKITDKNNEVQRYKDLILLNSDRAIGVTDKGFLNSVDIKNDVKNEKVIFQYDDMNSYGIIEKSPCGKFIILAGMHGNMHLYQFEKGDLNYKLSCAIKNKPKIFSVHWLSSELFLTCLIEGILILWYSDGENLIGVRCYQLPPSKERWSTSAALYRRNNKYIVVGDRKGNLYVYNINKNHPTQIIKKIQPMGITKIYYNHIEDTLIVLGRSGMLHKFNLDQKTGQIHLITRDKLPFSWLGAYIVCGRAEIVLGFTNDKFIVWNHTLRRTIFEISCGGGHRLWDFYLNRSDLTLIYQKIDKLTSVTFNFENDVKSVIDNFHGWETNCMKLIKIDSEPFRCISISGGEDTTLRLCQFNFDDNLNGFKVVGTVKSHLSSIRTIVYHKLEQTTENRSGNRENPFANYIFSAGGRAQIILWNLIVLNKNELNDIILKEIDSYYKELDENESEIRIMDMETTKIDHSIVLFAACSNGEIKMYRIDRNSPKIVYLQSISNKQRCILKLFMIKLGSFDFLVTAATDGYLTFTDITNFLKDLSSKTSSVFEDISLKTHQSGINSYDYYLLDENKAVILTGGDDKAFALTLIECQSRGNVEITKKEKFPKFERDKFPKFEKDKFPQFEKDKFPNKNVKVTKLGFYTNENYHFAHITGVYITKNYFITASIDQKLVVFSWSLENDNEFKVGCVHKRYVGTTDLQGIDWVVNEKRLELVLFGNGFETFSVHLS